VDLKVNIFITLLWVILLRYLSLKADVRFCLHQIPEAVCMSQHLYNTQATVADK